MRSRTSLCNRADLRVDFTRFAPLWAVYTAVLLALILMGMPYRPSAHSQASVLTTLTGLMAPVQFCYALVTSLTLFGYLYDARLCYAIHAMPQTRLCRFRTHVLSGLLFALAPDLLGAGLCLIIAPDVPEVTALWLIAVFGQYLFFFGFAVLAALCAGNRVGGVLIYGIGNFLSLLVGWIVYAVFQPLLYGVSLTMEPYIDACPLLRLTRESYIILESELNANFDLILKSAAPGTEQLGCLALCCCFSLVFLLIAGRLYRNRSLESAGELLSVKALRPVFLLLFTLCAGALFHILASIFVAASNSTYGYLMLGMVIGYFGGKMLLNRQVNVFKLRAVPGIAAICAVFLALLLLIGLDVPGIIRSIPDQEAIASVSVTAAERSITLDTPQDIQAALALHREQVDAWSSWRNANRGITGLLTDTTDLSADETEAVLGPVSGNAIHLTLSYRLKSGKTLERKYIVDVHSPGGELAGAFLTRPEAVLGVKSREELNALAGQVAVFCNDYQNRSFSIDNPLTLLNAIYDDCEAGRFLPGAYLPNGDNKLSRLFTLEIFTMDTAPRSFSLWLPIDSSYTSTVSCMKAIAPQPELE